MPRKPKTAAFLATICSPQTTGLRAQEWCPYGQGRIAAESAADQREDDGLSLCLDSAPLNNQLNIVGEVRVKLRVASDRSQAMVAVRLCDLADDGTSALITYGLLNLSHRDSHEQPSALAPGKFYDVVVTLKPIAQVVPAGHRLRLAISSAYWPMVWPSPELVSLSVDTGRLCIDLPVVPKPGKLGQIMFEKPEHAKPGSISIISPARESRQITYDIERETAIFRIESDDGRYVIDEIGTEVASKRVKVYEVQRNSPTTARTCIACHQEYRRGSWNPKVDTQVTVISDLTHFQIEGTVRAFDGEKVFASCDFEEKIPRDHL